MITAEIIQQTLAKFGAMLLVGFLGVDSEPERGLTVEATCGVPSLTLRGVGDVTVRLQALPARRRLVGRVGPFDAIVRLRVLLARRRLFGRVEPFAVVKLTALVQPKVTRVQVKLDAGKLVASASRLGVARYRTLRALE